MDQSNHTPGQGTGGGGRSTSGASGTGPATPNEGASAVDLRTARDDHPTQEAFIGSCSVR